MPLHGVSLSRLLAIGLLSITAHATVIAAPLDVQLTMSSLPSAQGFTYTPSGAHASAVETDVFPVSGGVLSMNSVGQSNGVSGGSILYNYLSGVTNGETKQIRVRARCLQVEASGTAPAGQGGFVFGFTANSTNYAFCLTPTRVGIMLSTGFFLFATTFDNTQFHDYRFEFTPPTTTRVYRDNALLGTSTAGFPAALTNRFWLGDGTGGANASGEVESFRFIQDVATGVSPTTWGRIKALYK